MKAGRELDALVAEKVMGYRQAYPRMTSTCKQVWLKDESEKFEFIKNFNPSTNIADAWQVVEKFDYKLRLEINGGYCTCRLVGNFNDSMVGQFSYAEADTAPLAICLAALESVGGEVT